MKSNIFIAGSGGIGQAAGLILLEFQVFDVSIYFGDVSQSAIDHAIRFVKEGCTHEINVHGVLTVSYTHLDVYKRQMLDGSRPTRAARSLIEVALNPFSRKSSAAVSIITCFFGLFSVFVIYATSGLNQYKLLVIWDATDKAIRIRHQFHTAPMHSSDPFRLYLQ